MEGMSTDTDRRAAWTDYLNNDPTHRGTGHRILEAHQAGYTRADIARMLHVSPSKVSEWATLARRGVQP